MTNVQKGSAPPPYPPRPSNSFVGAGSSNLVELGNNSAIFVGQSNKIGKWAHSQEEGPTSAPTASTKPGPGGSNNIIVTGNTNQIDGQGFNCFIAGGQRNGASGNQSGVFGGNNNTVEDSLDSVIMGGKNCHLSGSYEVLLSGQNNEVHGL